MTTSHTIRLCVTILNVCQRSQTLVEQALRIFRVLSSMGRSNREAVSRLESMTTLLLSENVVPSVHMAMSTYMDSRSICSHGLRIIQWIMETTDPKIIRIMLDEEILLFCTDLITNLDDEQVLQYACIVLSKFCFFMSVIGCEVFTRRRGTHRKSIPR